MSNTELKKYVNSICRICTASTEYEITSGDKINPYNDLVNSGSSNIKRVRKEWPSVCKEVKDIINNAKGITSNQKMILNKDIKNVNSLLAK